ncbi:MAG: aminomethyl-transferring glycine dehydrogenase subunit GcvPB [Chloroflexi bacterium]|nr:aminomethyl-transferring glycine dehydrogenase subunit GcvPB [Chloroflexota bacterium]
MDRRLLMDRSVPGRRSVSLPALDVPETPLPDPELLRGDLPLPELSELEVVRYFTHLSQMNYGVDSGFYPLGSCTMKYNPKVNDEVAGLAGFALAHPLQPEEASQGALQLMYELQGFLAEIAGLHTASLAPLAGAHGELAGMQVIRAYQRHRGQGKRKVVIIPDSAHGTNPASAAMCGYHVLAIPADQAGNLNLERLRQVLKDDVVALMITLPSTLGLFDQNIVEICRLVHEAGGLVYGDGANLNALLGQVKLGDLGFDVVHMNLHKTFSTPHGGGGPGAGPISLSRDLAPFAPTPIVVKQGETYHLEVPEQTIGRIAAFHGNFGVLVRAYAYIRMLGADGLRNVSRDAVLHANYIQARLRDLYPLPYNRRCMHEVVFSAAKFRKQGVRALDIAKRLIDYGFHPPTMYFPLVVDEALMVEPTETETKETVDSFIEAMRTIAKEAAEQPDVLHSAPHATPVGRLDEARAARHPDLHWTASSR